MSRPGFDPLQARRRHAARMAAVQALYQVSQSGDSASEVIRQFEKHRFDASGDEATIADPDREFFRAVVSGASERRDELDTLIGGSLLAGWTLGRVEQVIRAILAAGAFELMARPDIPAKVVVNEYADLAHDFHAASEAGFVNSVLDKLARRLRAGEFEPALNQS